MCAVLYRSTFVPWTLILDLELENVWRVTFVISGIAVTIGREIDFLAPNGSVVGHARIKEGTNFFSAAYNDVYNTMFLSDAKNPNGSIFSINLMGKKNFTMKPLVKSKFLVFIPMIWPRKLLKIFVQFWVFQKLMFRRKLYSFQFLVYKLKIKKKHCKLFFILDFYQKIITPKILIYNTFCLHRISIGSEKNYVCNFRKKKFANSWVGVWSNFADDFLDRRKGYYENANLE